MSDLYTEVLVEKQFTAKDMAIKVGMIFMTVLSVVAGVLIPPVLLAALAFGLLDYFFLPKLNVEYEYLYVNGELDIDKIFSKVKRKKGASYDLNNMEILAPVKSHQLDSYRNNPNIKTVDYSSGKPDAKVYAAIISKDDHLERLLFEPNDVMIRDIRSKMPRKVFTD